MFENLNQIIPIILFSFGGSGTLVFLLSSWLGKVWANRILEQDRLKYSKQFEAVKVQYEKQIEKYKHELELSKSMFFRYSDSQFNLYNTLWATLVKLKETMDDLWSDANLENLRSFGMHLDKTIKSIEKNRLLIEEAHYEKLQTVLETTNRFKMNKNNLIRLRTMTSEHKKYFDMTEIKQYIDINRTSKTDYERLLVEIVVEFKKQISFKS